MLVLFGISIFLSAALLFLVQPMAAKLALPLLGGSPAVWTTCMLFFQTLLLLGYLYGHMMDRWVRPSRQVLVHVLVMVAASASLPLGLAGAGTIAGLTWERLPAELTIAVWLLTVLGMAVGAPFFVVSTTGPLLQRWFSRTGHGHAKDPYFLYAASNAGSMLGLAAYPLAIEPWVGLKAQGVLWGWGYAAFCVLALACGIVMIARQRGLPGGDEVPDVQAPREPIPGRRKLRWLILAAVPSSLMLGVTQQVATDLASVPLLWIIPLALYLLTFILAFSPRLKVSAKAAGWALAVLAPAVLTTMILAWMTPMIPLVSLHFAAFFVAAYMCHKLLADDRPSADQLTGYYLIMAAGGVVGGLFNSIVAPLCFNDVYEYFIALTAALLLRPASLPPLRPVFDRVKGFSPWPVVRLAAAPLLMLAAMLSLGIALDNRGSPTAPTMLDELLPWLRTSVLLLPALFVIRRPAVFAVCFMIYAGSMYYIRSYGRASVVYQERSFFGVLRVIEQVNGGVRFLSHGTTTHGAQIFVSDNLRLMPTTYYHPTGPVGQVFSALGNDPVLKSVAVIGLGTGSLAAYAQPGDKYTFFDIDKSVIDIATGVSTPKPLFTYLKDSVGDLKVILADGRQGLQANSADGEYGLIVVDAFSSDAIPVHMLTYEAFQIYLSKLNRRGLLMIHVSNRHFELVPIVQRLAEELGCKCLYNDDHVASEAEQRAGKSASRWLVLGRDDAAIAPLLNAPGERWKVVRLHREVPLWTDDYSNVLDVLK